MPRNPSGQYNLPAGVIVSAGEVIQPSQHNPALQDIAQDLNDPRPIASGGTGATSATAARTSLGAQAAWTEVGPVNTSSGTAFDVTSLPAGVSEIEIMFDFVSLSGADNILVQLGTASGFETANYWTGRVAISGTTVAAPGAFADEQPGFLLRTSAASGGIVGTMRLVRGASAVLWHQTFIGSTDNTTMLLASGRKYLAGPLAQFRVTRTGSNTFDLGLLNVRYR
jgi:hypothetical protein